MRSLFVVSLVTIGLLVGCSDSKTPSPSRVKEVISKQLDGSKLDAIIQIGTFTQSCVYNEIKEPEYKVLSRVGLIAVSQQGKTATVQLTEAGKKFFAANGSNTYAHKSTKECDYSQLNVPLGKRKFKQLLSGIALNGDFATAKFTFTYELNDAGKALLLDGSELSGEERREVQDHVRMFSHDLLSPEWDKAIEVSVPIDQFGTEQFAEVRLQRYDTGWNLVGK